ncbi:MAG: sugar nucleotide-binding protein, partial [Nitrospiraceae bacterium]
PCGTPPSTAISAVAGGKAAKSSAVTSVYFHGRSAGVGSGAAAKVVPIRSAEAGRHAARPAYSVLGNHVLARYGIVLPHWKESLTRFMRDRQAVTSAKS